MPCTWRHGDEAGKQTQPSGGEKVEESSSNHRHTGPLPRAQRLLGLLPLTSHLLSSSRDRVRAGTSEEGVLEGEPSAVAVSAAEANRRLGRKGRTGCTQDNLPGRATPLAPPAAGFALSDPEHHF